MSVATPPPADYAPRELRALDLSREHGDEIRDLGEYTFEVHSSTGSGTYLVRYGAGEEGCVCPDFGFGHTCKHLLCVGVMHAARRSGIREVRTMAVVAGDPFAHAAKTGVCSGCGHRFRHRDLVEVQEDHESLTWFPGDRLCAGCARDTGIL